MTDSIYSWSTTPATNATVDSQINWQENQAPDTVNNSARQEMARVAEFRSDLSVAQALRTAFAVSLAPASISSSGSMIPR